MTTEQIIQFILVGMSAISTVVIAVLSYFVFKINKQMAWFTGAMESHSEIQYLLSAQRDKIPIVWWDPTIEKVPNKPKHGDPVEIKKIYRYLPVNLRQGKKKL